MPAAKYEHAGAERAEQPLVARSGQQVAADLGDVDRHVSERLGGVDEKEHAVLGRDLADFGGRLNRAGDVRGVD